MFHEDFSRVVFVSSLRPAMMAFIPAFRERYYSQDLTAA
jgi:hypothetical protein